MLPHYSPFKVAETFTILAGLYPGRIDLGIGRASGTDPLTTFALQRDRRQASPDDFPQQLAELLAYFADTLPDDHPFQRLAASPPRPPRAARAVAARLIAAERDLGRAARSPLRLRRLHQPGRRSEIAAVYRDRFEPSPELAAPRTAVAAWALCAPTDEEAQYLASSSRMTLRLLRRGELIPVPPPEKAIEFLAREGKSVATATPGRRAIIGSPEKVRAGLETLAQEYGAEEVIVVTITHDHAARRRSYELLAEAMGLQRRPLAAAA